MKRYVVLSTNLNENYLFFAPLTAAVWKRHGFEPLVVLVGYGLEWQHVPRGKLVIERLRDAGAYCCHTLHRTGAPRASTEMVTTSQLVRIYGANIPYEVAPGTKIEDDDYLLTSDIDMWPLGPWPGHMVADDRAHLYNGAAYHDQSHPQYPMCYVGARARIWREIVGGGNLEECLARGFAAMEEARWTWAPGEQRERAWDFDERYLGRLLSAWSGEKLVIPRDMSVHGQRRLDRSCWQLPASLDGFADAHLPRPGFLDYWPSVRKLFGALLPDKLAWADEYHAAWVRP